MVEIISLVAEPGWFTSRRAAFHCPLHEGDREASLMVFSDNQDFHCFGCGVHGDVIEWIQLQEHLTFWDALLWLADYYGIPHPQRSRPGKPGQQKRYYNPQAHIHWMKKIEIQIITSIAETLITSYEERLKQIYSAHDLEPTAKTYQDIHYWEDKINTIELWRNFTLFNIRRRKE